MSKVKLFSPPSQVWMGCDENGSYVLKTDFDRVTAERDQLRLEAMSKNGSFKALGAQVAALQRAVTNRDKLKLRAESHRDAALGREAALREELATANGCLEEWRRSNLGKTLLENVALQQRLTAADERVDVLEGLLRRTHKSTALTKAGDLWQRIDAALKPAEVPINQCDGCQAGIPVVNGAHRMGKTDGYPDTMSCTANLYVQERPDGCCCPPKGHTGLWAAAMCPVHQGLRAIKR